MLETSQISEIGLFADVDPDDLGCLVTDVMPMRVGKGQLVIEKGDLTSDLFLVLEGRLGGVLMSDEGKEIAYAEFGVKSFFGEMAALDQGPRSLTITAAEPSLLGRVRGDRFLQWLEKYPQIARNVMRELTARNRRLNERIFELVVHDVETRVKLMLVRLAIAADQMNDGGTLDPAPTHSDIASHVGANREAVSRVLSRLRDTGAIRPARKKIEICRVDALVAGL